MDTHPISDFFQNNGIPRSSSQIANIFPPIVTSHVLFSLDRTVCVMGPSCILLNQHHRHFSVLTVKSVAKSYPSHVTQPKSPSGDGKLELNQLVDKV